MRRDHSAVRRSLLNYQQLRAAAVAAECWPTEREKALAVLRADAERGHLARLTRVTGNHAYEQLVSLLLNIRDCHRRLGTPDDFTAYGTDLRAAQKRKRNLMRLREQHGL